MKQKIIIKVEKGLIQYVNIPEELKDIVVEVRDFDIEDIDEDRVHFLEEKSSLFYGQAHSVSHWERRKDPKTTDECQETICFNL